MRVLIADDHALFREGLELQLRRFDAAMEIVQAPSFKDAIARAEQGPRFDLVLLDLDMPGMAWQRALEALGDEEAPPRVVILSASEDQDTVRLAMSLGAAGFIPKSTSSKVMWNAIRLVLEGGTYLPPQLLVREAPARRDLAAEGNTAATLLTRRQREVLALIGKGRSNKEIARVLELTEGTVKLHVTAILKVLGVTNRTQAVIEAQKKGVMPRN